ncbi:ArsR family transcriptional regulator [Formivibrio citricus]|uniref:ArsR family transcriptional regulator n=1 Tax=Formivibrio citricus TaxID=83765 RepID=A0A1I4WJ63_9NEIS|nr:metalloregulator ArsR/SmtB family transcription factor [Formivibrio citricus]SFN13293.1 ArsR family transcriptional regulator [Formivibrio citricus]
MISLDSLFVVLSDPNRRRILALLCRRDELCVCQLMAALELPQPKVSRYLSQIRAVGVLDWRKQGTWMHYRLHPELPRWACKLLDDLLLEPETAAQLQADLARVSCRESVV